MTCASCGRQVATGARYCIHCGAEQSVPTPIAAVAAAAMARRGNREAANAAHADPAGAMAPGRPANGAGHNDSSLGGFGPDGVVRAANSEQPTRPAYADAPRRRGLAMALIACLAVVAIGVGAVAFWRSEGGHRDVVAAAPASAPEPATAPATPAAAPAQPPAASTEAPPSASAPTVDVSPSAPDTAQTASTAAAAGTAAAPDANAPVEIKPLPPHPASARAAHQAQPTQPTASTANAPEAAPSEAAPQTNVAQTPPPARARAAAPATPQVIDRWQRLNDELSRCTREDFITRVICGQRVRFRYCDGYWGKVPQCPGNPTTPERGQ